MRCKSEWLLTQLKLWMQDLINYFFLILWDPWISADCNFFQCLPRMKFSKAGFVQNRTSEHRTVRRGEPVVCKGATGFPCFRRKKKQAQGSLDRNNTPEQCQRWGKGSCRELIPPSGLWPTEMVKTIKIMHLNANLMYFRCKFNYLF